MEALARYLHAHAELRAFLDQQRRSTEPMAWVNLACQHLPITATARQKLLDADAAERCLKIARGLDALLRKEQSEPSRASRGCRGLEADRHEGAGRAARPSGPRPPSRRERKRST